MRRVMLCVQMITLLLLASACGGEQAEETALALRARYLEMRGCALTADITADYGNRVYDFSVSADYRKDGDCALTITAPDILAGIGVRYENGGAALSYDGAAVETGSLSAAGLSPLGALPALLNACRSGGITETCFETLDGFELLRMTCDDNTGGDALSYSLWLDAASGAPVRGEIALDGYTVITCVFTSFSFEAA